MVRDIINGFFCLTLFLVCQNADAGLIVVTGDRNIGNGIDGSFFSTPTPGNSTLFQNVLGGGTNVLIHDDFYNSGEFGAQLSTNAINTFYNGLTGVSSTIDSSGSTITTLLLSGVDLLISSLPSNEYSSIELMAFSDFLAGSGTIFFLGENNNFSDENSRINSALSGLGSSLSITGSGVGDFFPISDNIDSDPLTSGIVDFTYASGSVVSGGTSLIRSIDSSGAMTIVAYENVGSASTVPEPTSMALWGLGSLGIGVVVRRRKSHS